MRIRLTRLPIVTILSLAPGLSLTLGLISLPYHVRATSPSSGFATQTRLGFAAGDN